MTSPADLVFQHATNNRDGKRKQAHNRHAGAAAYGKALRNRRSRRSNKRWLNNR